MNREAYKLANRFTDKIETEPGAGEDFQTARLDDVEMQKYKNRIVQEIKKEKKARRNTFRKTAAACAMLVLLLGVTVFGDEVHAAVKQISWNLSNALSLSGDLADYSEVVNTSVKRKGYIVTLHEALTTEEKLMVNFTVERADGGSMEEMPEMGIENVYINGKIVERARSWSFQFLDAEHKILGVVGECYISGTDISQENDYVIEITRRESIANVSYVCGQWDFSFKASGEDLSADTKRTAIGKTFTLPDGVQVMLKEFTTNKLEQIIYYELSANSDYRLDVNAVDSAGKRAKFGTRVQSEEGGYMQNERMVDDGRLDEEADAVTMTLYAEKILWEDSQDSGYVQVGEPFTVEIGR